MFVRFVRLEIREHRLGDFREFYSGRIVPALAEVDGCLFTSLLEPTREGGETLSVTLWTSQPAAEAYEASGLYDELLDECDEFLAPKKGSMTGDEVGPISAASLPDPAIDAFTLGDDDAFAPAAPTHPLFVRMVSMKVEPERLAELRRRYEQRVGPAMRATAGCREAFLLVGHGEHPRALSVTFWDREEDAVRYELSGAFDHLIEVLKECLSDAEQWRLAVAADGQATRRDLDVRRYRIVTARRLQQ